MAPVEARVGLLPQAPRNGDIPAICLCFSGVGECCLGAVLRVACACCGPFPGARSAIALPEGRPPTALMCRGPGCGDALPAICGVSDRVATAIDLLTGAGGDTDPRLDVDGTLRMRGTSARFPGIGERGGTGGETTPDPPPPGGHGGGTMVRTPRGGARIIGLVYCDGAEVRDSVLGADGEAALGIWRSELLLCKT
jgi:hypothetical protein